MINELEKPQALLTVGNPEQPILLDLVGLTPGEIESATPFLWSTRDRLSPSPFLDRGYRQHIACILPWPHIDALIVDWGYNHLNELLSLADSHEKDVGYLRAIVRTSAALVDFHVISKQGWERAREMAPEQLLPNEQASLGMALILPWEEPEVVDPGSSMISAIVATEIPIFVELTNYWLKASMAATLNN